MTLSIGMRDGDRERIKLAFAQDCDETGMTRKRLAQIIDFDEGRLSRCANKDHQDMPPLVIVLAVGSLSRNFRALHVMADVCGFTLSRFEQRVAPDLIDQTAQVLTEAGEAVAALAAYHRQPTRNTAVVADKECGELIDIAGLVRRAVASGLSEK